MRVFKQSPVRPLAMTGVGLAMALAASDAAAQDSDGIAGESAQDVEQDVASGIQTIVVTARRREESLQETPISITAFGSDALEARQVSNVGQISDVTPNLTINTSAAFSGSAATPSIFLRGVGQVDFSLNTDPGVGLYVDGVYISRAVGGLIDLLDIERIEVLRGPQGTLFGRNTIGGAVNVTSKAPEDDFTGRFKVTTGSDDRIQLQGLVNVPLGENLAARFAANYHRRDGYVFRPNVGDYLGDDNSFSTRGTIAFDNGPLQLTLSGDYSRRREASAPFIITAIDPGAPFAGFHNAVVAPLIDPSLAFPLGPMGPPSACLIGASNPACFNPESVSVGVPGINQGTRDSFADLDVYGVSFTAEYELSDAVTIKSITAYRDLRSDSTNEPDAAPVSVNSTVDSFDYNQFSQELQLLGEGLDGRLNWILGAYYFTEEGVNENLVNFSVIEILSGGRVENRSIAGFGQASFEVADGLFLTGGLRWTRDERDFTPDQRVLRDIATGIPDGTPILPNVTASTSTTKLTPMANIRYEWTPDVSTYFTYSQGFKSGGFTQRVFPPLIPAPGQDPVEVIPAFDAETVDTFEVGLKSQLLDDTVQLNAALFTTKYNDLQVNVQVGIAPTTQNAAEATINGAELELLIVPVRNFSVNFGLGLIDAQYDRLDAGVVGITLDSKLPGTSDVTASAGASYTAELGDFGSLTFRGDVAMRSDLFFDANNEVGQDGYTTLNLGLTWESVDGMYSASVFGTNITDTRYAVAGASILDPGGFQQKLFARGAEWGASLSVNF